MQKLIRHSFRKICSDCLKGVLLAGCIYIYPANNTPGNLKWNHLNGRPSSDMRDHRDLSLSLCVSLCVSLSFCMSVCLSLCLCLSVFLPACLSQSLCLCFCLCLSLSLSVSVCLCLCLSLSDSLFLDFLLAVCSELRSSISESRGGRPGLPVPNSPYDLCGRKATLEKKKPFKKKKITAYISYRSCVV